MTDDRSLAWIEGSHPTRSLSTLAMDWWVILLFSSDARPLADSCLVCVFLRQIGDATVLVHMDSMAVKLYLHEVEQDDRQTHVKLVMDTFRMSLGRTVYMIGTAQQIWRTLSMHMTEATASRYMPRGSAYVVAVVVAAAHGTWVDAPTDLCLSLFLLFTSLAHEYDRVQLLKCPTYV